MFTYLHCYLPETWEAQIHAGLIGKNAGIRFPQSIDIPEEAKFNIRARVGGDLYHLLRDLRCPFYIDRLQGGCYIEDYPYDMALVGELRELLGENFWGFQMHEWPNNFRGDVRKMIRNGCPSWTEKDILETIFRAYPFKHPYLESMNAAELAENGCPGSWEEMLSGVEALYERRQKYTGGFLLPCDSSDLAYPIELKRGTKRFMPEIGAQTPDTRIQISYARGMARAYGVPFGAYYEPWSWHPTTACCYQLDGKNEWNIAREDFPYATEGENGGSSRSMQRRMHLYAYLAGASFISEEWGMCNTFYDWKDFDLSPYGKVKLDFIRFTEKYPDVGEPVTPVAVILPRDLPVLEGVRRDDDILLDMPVEGDFAARLRNVRKGLRDLFCSGEPLLGTEVRSLLNCPIPDAMDIVNEDRFDAGIYDFLVDLTGRPDLRAKYGKKVISPEEAEAVLERLLPCSVEGNVHKLVTRRKDGTRYLLLLNNSGVCRSVEAGEALLEEARTTAFISIREGGTLTRLEGDASISRTEDGRFAVTIPAGGWFFGRF